MYPSPSFGQIRHWYSNGCILGILRTYRRTWIKSPVYMMWWISLLMLRYTESYAEPSTVAAPTGRELAPLSPAAAYDFVRRSDRSCALPPPPPPLPFSCSPTRFDGRRTNWKPCASRIATMTRIIARADALRISSGLPCIGGRRIKNDCISDGSQTKSYEKTSYEFSSSCTDGKYSTVSGRHAGVAMDHHLISCLVSACAKRCCHLRASDACA